MELSLILTIALLQCVKALWQRTPNGTWVEVNINDVPRHPHVVRLKEWEPGRVIPLRQEATRGGISSRCLLDEVQCPTGSNCDEPKCDGTRGRAGGGGNCPCRPFLAREPRTGSCLPPGPSCRAFQPADNRIPNTEDIPTGNSIVDSNENFAGTDLSPRRPSPASFPSPQQPETRAVAPVQPAPFRPNTPDYTDDKEIFPPPNWVGCDTSGRPKYLKEGGQTMLYRLYNDVNKDHLLTRYLSEVSTAVRSHNFKFEGPIGRIAGSQNDVLVECPQLVPIHRLYRLGFASSDHFFTIHEDQRERALSLPFLERYEYQGISGYCVPQAACGANLRLYRDVYSSLLLHKNLSSIVKCRYYDSTNVDHFYTTEPGDLARLQVDADRTWVQEGVECYIWPI